MFSTYIVVGMFVFIVFRIMVLMYDIVLVFLLRKIGVNKRIGIPLPYFDKKTWFQFLVLTYSLKPWVFLVFAYMSIKVCMVINFEEEVDVEYLIVTGLMTIIMAVMFMYINLFCVVKSKGCFIFTLEAGQRFSKK
jgi:hypothetical protein